MATTKKQQSEAVVTAEDIARYDDIQSEIKRLTAEKDRIATLIKSQFEPGNYESGDYIVDLSKTIGTLNKVIFQHDFPLSEFPELYEQVPSTDAIKEYLGEERAEYYTPVLRLTVKPKGKAK